MVDLLYCEMLKLKRSKMFQVSFLGAIAAPLICFIGCIKSKILYPEKTIVLSKVFSETNLYILLLIGVILYGVITAYLFSREYSENTLKSILTLPVSKTKFIFSKYMMLFIWIISLTVMAWMFTLGFGLVIQLKGLSLGILIKTFAQYITGGCLIFLLTTPFVFITLWLRNFVPVIVLSAVITMGNITLANDVDFIALYPWSAVYVISSGKVFTKYPLAVSLAAIFAVSIVGLLASLAYFKKTDIR